MLKILCVAIIIFAEKKGAHMGYCCSRVLVALLVCSLALLVPVRVVEGQYGCTIRDDSYLEYQSTCGTQEYQLQVEDDTLGGIDQQFQEAWAYGVCDGGYYNCSNTYVEQGVINGGSPAFSDDGPGGDYQEEMHWALNDWAVTYSSCNNGNPNDEVQNTSYVQDDTSEFEVFCD